MSTPAVCMSNKNGANSAAPILCARPLARPLAHTAEQRFMWTHDRPFLGAAPLAHASDRGLGRALFASTQCPCSSAHPAADGTVMTT